jgi:hypothetical protein
VGGSLGVEEQATTRLATSANELTNEVVAFMPWSLAPEIAMALFAASFFAPRFPVCSRGPRPG